MRKKCPCRHSQYLYHASAYGLMGDFQRPSQQNVPMQGSVLLPANGGLVSQRLPKFKLDGLISFDEAYVEAGGSYDECHDVETSYALSVIVGLNIADMLTADRVVARMAVYSPIGDHGGEHTFDITGSYFENLKIAGHEINLKLATAEFNDLSSYSKFKEAYKTEKADKWLLFYKLAKLETEELKKLEDRYHALYGMSGMIKTWKTDTTETTRDRYWCSAASDFDLSKHTGENSELKGHGAVICIPKFGVIRLAEMLITKDTRSLTMFRVDMCSTGHGTTTGGTTTGGGGTGFPIAPPS